MMSKYVDKNDTLHARVMGTNSITVYDCDQMNYSHFHPEIKVINARKKIVNESYKLNNNFLSINESFVDKKYTCMERKICEAKGRESVLKHLMNVYNIPEDIKQLANKTGVFKMRSEEKTYFVSSILKGYCLRQVQVFVRPERTNGTRNLSKETPVHISRVSVANNNKTLETWVNDYLNGAHQSLFNVTLRNREIILEQIKNATVVYLELEPLPALPPQ
ncbi:uncharacterized protein LOC130674413 isoform X1 [Microplitis mediator]|uniref:uncharacterized protein LOC130674413 isoform X1 n=1 Tax=Microplitis mediator TaxID=375433 RepID=UPI0025572EB1|nr:uncharacterized protein LOC130674413 isoform X1 [Microplitis mediator]